MPLCVKWYSASNSGLLISDIGLLTLGSSTLGFSSSVMICLTYSFLLLEKLFVSGSGSGIGISNLGRLAVLLVNGI